MLGKKRGGKLMKSRALMTGVAAVSMVLAVALVVQARPFFGPGSRDRGMGAGIGGLKAVLELKLSGDQQAQLNNIISKYEEQRAALRTSVMETRKNIAAVLKAEKFDEENARKAFREASEVRENLFVLRAKMLSEMKAVLTPQQLQMLQERKARRHERMKNFQAWPENPSE
jgi:Spy/CpxP family protein refolding chaperone